MKPKNTWLLVALAAGLFAYIVFFDHPPKLAAPGARRVLPDLKAANVTSLQIQWEGQPAMSVTRTNGHWQMIEPITYPAQPLVTDSLLQELEKLAFHTHISPLELKDHPNADEEFGFKPPVATFIIQQTGQPPRQIQFGRPTPAGDEVYLKVVGAGGIEVVDIKIFTFVPRKPGDLRDTSFVTLAGLPLNRLTITNGARFLELERPAKDQPWHMERPTPARADNARIESLLYALETLGVTSFVTDDSGADLEAYGLKPAELELGFYQNTNLLTGIEIGRSPTNDDSLVYARHTGQKSIVLVRRAPLEPWRGQYADFRDRHLAGLRAANLDLLEVQSRGGEKFSVQRVTNDTWVVLGTATFSADAARMRDFLEDLGRLQTVSINGEVAVKDLVPASAWGTNYGLAPPARSYLLKTTVSEGGAFSNSLVAQLDFGALTEDKDKVYARRPDGVFDSNSVYAVSVTNFERLPARSLQLRERRIWKFSAENVRSITIKEAGGSRQLLHKGPNDWQFAANSNGLSKGGEVVEAAADELAELAAENWTDLGAQNRARYGFTSQSPQILVNLVVGDKAGALTLDLGGWSPHRLRYGCVQLEGQDWIFELPKTLYERLVYYLSLNQPTAP